MKECIENFGKDNDLCGTLCLPDEKDALVHGLPCIVMLNSGLIYQAGPSRLHVELAAKLANSSFPSFRFDLSGIGDSKRHRDTRPYEEQISNDIDDALIFIERKIGISTFVLMGICTGADNTHKAAVKNKNIVGAIFLDGYTYITPGYYFRYYGKRLINPIQVIKWLYKAFSIKPFKTKTVSNVEQTQVSEGDGSLWNMPPKKKTLRDLQLLIDRKVNQLHIYTGDWEWGFNHQSQFNSMYQDLDFGDLATCIYIPQAAHTFTMIDDKLFLIRTITTWMKDKYISKV